MKTQTTFTYKIIHANKNKLLKLNTTMRQYRKCINFYLHHIAKGTPLKDIYYYAKTHYHLPTGLIQTARDIATEQYSAYENNETNSHFPHFSGFTTMRMDKRTISFHRKHNHFEYWASIATIDGRIKVPITGRGIQRLNEDFKSVQVIFKNNSFYLHVSFEQEHPIPKEQDFEFFVGIDLGIKNIVTVVVQNRKGKFLEIRFFSGKRLMEKRRRYAELRAKLQAKGAWDTLKRIKGKEKNYMKDINHKVSTEIIRIARRYPNCCIVMENLKGIRNKISYVKKVNKQRHDWVFAQLREFITYKAHNHSIAIRTVYPAYTSQVCGHCLGKVRRRSQSKAVCETCKKEYHADLLGAVNVVRRLFGYMSGTLGCSESTPEQGSHEYEGGTAQTFGQSKGFVAQVNTN